MFSESCTIGLLDKIGMHFILLFTQKANSDSVYVTKPMFMFLTGWNWMSLKKFRCYETLYLFPSASLFRFIAP